MSSCCSVNGKTQEAPKVLACPECGSRSKQVDRLTVKSLVRHLPFGMPTVQHYFCATPGCAVVYFPSGLDAPVFRRADLLVRVGAKETADPILVCYCFGITRQAIWQEIERTGSSTAAARIKAEVKAGRCACEVKNPSGKCCLGNVTRTAQEAARALKTIPAASPANAL